MLNLVPPGKDHASIDLDNNISEGIFPPEGFLYVKESQPFNLFLLFPYFIITFLFTVYCNNSANSQTLGFTEINIGQLSAFSSYKSGCQWIDYDNDGDLDIFYSYGGGYLGIYRNDGGNNFQKNQFAEYVDAFRFVWGDYDKDDDLDLFACNKLFRNNGNGTFTVSVISTLENKVIEGLDLGDVDNDGDLDIVCLMADNVSYGLFARILFNNNGTFSKPYFDFPGYFARNVKFTDFDKDNFPDLVITFGDSTILYRNNNLDFTRIGKYSTYEGLSNGKINITDYDSDFDSDILASGNIILNNYPVFNVAPPLTGWPPSAMEVGDVDNDGDLDAMYIRYYNTSILYLNNGGTYVNSGLSFPSLPDANADWGDYDNDGDLDLAVVFTNGGNPYLRLYQNTLNTLNSAPSPPSSLSSSVSGNTATISWNKGTDTEGSANGLLYNIYIMKTSSIIKPAQTNIINGFLRLNFEGNVQQALSYKIGKLSAGSYSWSVQSIDQGAKGSAFAATQNFTITYASEISPSANQSILPGVNGSTLTVTETGSFDSRYWAYAVKPGGPYQNLGSTSTTYTPNFANTGDYYVVCKSIKGSDTATSNEVNVSVSFFEEIELSGIGSSTVNSIEMVDFDNDDDYDILTSAYTNSAGTVLYQNNSNVFSSVAGFSPTLVTKASSTCFDYNNDGLIDILISGQTSPAEYALILYKNNGGLIFEQVGTISEGVINGSIDHGDYDNDGLIDIIISGSLVNTERTTKILRNTGNGTFVDINAILAPVSNGTTKFIDLNNDGYLDVFLTGTDLSSNPSTVSYINDGNGNFQPSDYTFKNLKESHADFGDYNNDGYLDILVTGLDPYKMMTYLYKNLNGSQYQEILISYGNSSYNYCEWLDFDNDGDLDIIAVSDNSKRDGVTAYSEDLILENKGNDSFVKNLAFPRQMNYKGSSAFKIFRYDADSDADFIQSVYNPATTSNKLVIYKNLTPNVKTLPVIPSGLTSHIVGNNVILSWNDGKPGSIPSSTFNISIFSGTSYIVNPQANIINGFRKVAEYGDIRDTTWIVKNLPIGNHFWRVQAIDNSLNPSSFTSEATLAIENDFKPNYASTFENISSSGADWGDYDNDGDLDLVIAGSSSGGYITKIYKNVNNVFQVVNIPLTGIYANPVMYVEWLDVNNDNNMDLVLFGNTTSDYSTGRVLKIYINMGGDVFSNIYTYIVTGGSLYALAHGDIDNDGDIDFMISPYKIIKNNGNLTFTEITDNSIYGSYLDIIDVDNDLDFDVAGIGGYLSNLKLNNGNDNFTNLNNILPFLNSGGEIRWFDYNNDSYIDFVMTGLANSYYITKIMKNDRDNTFSEVNTILKGSQQGNLSFGDYNNDGDFDFFINGKNNFAFNELYDNNNYTNFVGIDYNFPNNGYRGKSAMGDFDNDGDLDIISTGFKDGTGNITTLYENAKNWPNTKPSVPGNPRYERSGFGVILRWDAATDAESKNGGLSYNIRLGTTPGGCDIISPLSDVSSGFRKVSKIGNAQFNLAYKLRSLPIGKYYWSVQAIDHSFLGGNWAPEQTFTLTSINVNFNFTEVCQGFPTAFQDLSVGNNVTISNWNWDFGDGSYSTLQHPAHVFGAAGTYQVKLVASYLREGIITPGDSITKTVTVKAKPVTNFTANIVCQGTSTTLVNTSNLNGLTISSWNWNFGDGQTSSAQNPGVHGYLNAGDYTVKLKASATNGCSDSIQKTVSVGAYPVAAVTSNAPLTFCSGDSVTLSVGSNPNYSYKWMMGGTAITNAISNSYKIKQSGSYTVEVINSVGNCTKTSDAVVVTVQAVPSSPVISAGSNTTFCQGDSVILSVIHNPAYIYSWKLNGGSIGSNNSALTAKSSGLYSLVVTNTAGCTTNSSNTITMTVNAKPVAPTVSLSGNTSFCQGDNVVLTVTNNPALTYRWTNSGNTISGAISNSYTATGSGIYKLIVTNSDGCFNATQEINVNVIEKPSAPTISVSGSTTFCSGDSVILSTQNIPAYTYQWKLNGGAIGSNFSTLVAKASGTFSLQITNSAGCSVNSSNTVPVTSNPKPVVPSVNISGSTSFCTGSNVVLSVVNNPLHSYQWMNTGNNISGQVINSYTATNTGKYALKVTTAEGCSGITQEVSVTVYSLPAVPTINAGGSLTFCQGDSVILEATYNPACTYQWKLNAGNIGSNKPSLSAKITGTYSLEVTNTSGCSVISSNTQNVLVNSKPVAPTVSLSGSTNFCQGGSVILSVTENPDYRYRWKNNDNNISGATSSNYTATSSGIYKLNITNPEGCSDLTQAITVTVLETPQSPVINADGPIIFCTGDSVLLSVSNDPLKTYYWKLNSGNIGSNNSSLYAKASGNYSLQVTNTSGCSAQSTNSILVISNSKPAIPSVNISGATDFCQGSNVVLSVLNNPVNTYQWVNIGNNISGATTNSYTATNTGKYVLKVTNTDGCSSQSQEVVVNVSPTPGSPTINTSGATIFCQGDSVLLSVTSNPAYTYQWKLNGGAVGQNQSGMSARTTGVYSLQLTNSYGCSALSTNTISVTSNAKPAIPSVNISGATSFCEGSSVVLSVTNDPSYNYQWLNTGNNITGATTNSYTSTGSGKYALKVTNAEGCWIQTQEVNVNVLQTPASPTISAGGAVTFCQGDSVMLSVTNNPALTYRWKLNGGDVGTNTSEYKAKSGGTYILSVTNTFGCSNTSTNSVVVTVKSLPVLSTVGLSGSTEFCEGGSLTMTMTATSGYTYRWDNANGAISGATSNSYQATVSGNYRLAVTNQEGCELKSPPIQVNVKPNPVSPVIISDNYTANQCKEEKQIILRVSQTASDYKYQWESNGIILLNATQSSYQGNIQTGSYAVTVDKNGCSKKSENLSIVLTEGPAKPSILAEGPKVWFLACSDTTATQYRWYYNGQLISGASTYLYIANQKLGTYMVSIAKGQGCFTTSDPVTIPTGTTGIGEADPFSNLKIYPNPTTGLFTIEMNNQLYGELNISIFTNEGRNIQSIKFEKATQYFSAQVDLSGQIGGNYIVKLLINKYEVSRKLIVN